MKYGMQLKLTGTMLGLLVRKDFPRKETRKSILSEYLEILMRASDIGSKNRLLSSYMLGAYFIAMNRRGGKTPEENIRILEQRMRQSKALKALMGDSRHYFGEKAMESRRQWSRETHDSDHQKRYPNDWVVDVIEKTEDFQFGFDYLQCGVCKLCRDEGCPELARYLCSLDYMLTELIGIRLKRTQVLAEGAEKCDFRFLK